MAKARKRNTNPVQNVATGTTIRIQAPKSGRTRRSATQVVVEEMNPVGGFVDFLRDHAIVGLSIGFILGTQMSAFVKVLVQSFLDPLTQLLFGTALSQRTFSLHFHGRAASFGWGVVAYNLIIIILLLILIYATVKFFNLEKLDKAKKDENK